MYHLFGFIVPQFPSHDSQVLKYSIAHCNITTVVFGSFLAACSHIMDRPRVTRRRSRSRSPRVTRRRSRSRSPRRFYCYHCRTCGREYFSQEKIKKGERWSLPRLVVVIRTPRTDWVAADGIIVTSSRKFVCRVSCDSLHNSGCAGTSVKEKIWICIR